MKLVSLDKWLNQVHLLPVWTGINGRLLVVLDQLLQGGKPSLANVVDSVAKVHAEVLVSQWSF